MSILLDTHVVLWWLTGNPRLPADVKTTLDDDPNVYVSSASVWEVSIKQSAGKLPEQVDLSEEIRTSGFRELQISFEHALRAGRLPLIHHDPFDRMLVAQAQHEDLTLVTHDPLIQKYEVPLLVI